MQPTPLIQQNLEISRLILRDLRNELTDQERAALDKWVQACEANRSVYESLRDVKNVLEGHKDFAVPDIEASLTKIKKELTFTTEKHL
jgi:hypothetical protein